jgi:hypothetical protein
MHHVTSHVMQRHDLHPFSVQEFFASEHRLLSVLKARLARRLPFVDF